MHRHHTSVATIVVIALVAATTLLLGTLGLFSYRSSRAQQWDNLRRDNSILADHLSVALALPVWNFDREQIDRIIQGAMRDDNVAAVVVRLADRRATVHARARDAQWGVRVVTDEPAGDGLLEEIRDITTGGDVLGAVRVLFTPRYVEAGLRKTRLAMIGLLVTLDAILILALYLLLWKLVLRPLKQLELHAAAFSSGNEGTENLAGKQFHGELENLRASLQTMEGLLAARYAALQKSDDELRAQTALLQAQVDSTLDGLLVVDSEGKKILQNRRMNELWKIPLRLVEARDDAGQLRFMTGQTKDPGQFADKVAHLYSHPDEVSRDEIEQVDGTVLDRYSAPVRDEAGKHYGRIWTFRDITERKLAEENLRRSEERFRQLIENASDVIIVVDTAGIIRFQSPSTPRVLGYAPEETTGRSAAEFIHPEDRARTGEIRHRMMAGLESGTTMEHRVRHRDGTWRILQSVGKRMKGAAGESLVVVNSRDITESRQLEEQFRQAQKMEAIGQLSGGVAHDFNNLLTVIKGHIGLLEMAGHITPETAEPLRDIGAAADRAANLTRQLLAFSRRQVLQLSDIDVNAVVTDMAKMLQRIMSEAIEMRLDCGPQPMPVHADPSMIEQILMNLAVNSRDAMPRGGRLAIATAGLTIDEPAVPQHPGGRPGAFIRLSVSDTGTGIPPEVLPKIFEPFFTTKAVGKGTGLGLATVYGIVQQHHGWIEIESAADRGTTFHIYLPKVAAPAVVKAATAPATPPRGGLETILVVEDEPVVSALIRITLSRAGYQVLTASTGAAALMMWKEHRDEIRLVLTDMVIPGGMSGSELGRQLLLANPRLRLIYTSGYSPDVAGKDFPLQEGVNFVAKPFSPAVLANAVRESLDARLSGQPFGDGTPPAG